MDRKQGMLDALEGKFNLCPPNVEYEKELNEIRSRRFEQIKKWGNKQEVKRRKRTGKLL